MLNPPIFVIGPLRSGTTLLRLMLNRHSKLHFFGEFEGAVSQINGIHWPKLDAYYDFCQTDRQMLDLDLSVDRSLSYPELVASFLAELESRSEKPFIGASVHSRIDMLPEIWPSASFIHLLRDPRDVARSCIGMGWVGNVYYGADYWIKSEKRALSVAQQVSRKQYFTVRYEELVGNPEHELGKLCDFIGIGYEPNMLNVDESSTYSRPDARYANQWERKLSQKQIVWVENKCYGQMLEKGYEPKFERKLLNPVEKLALSIHNRLFRARHGIRRYGPGIWFSNTASRLVRNTKWQRAVQLRKNEIDRQYLK